MERGGSAMVEVARGVDSKSRSMKWDDLMRCGEKWISIPGDIQG